MAWGKKKSFRKGGDDKYLRLTGLWPSKHNDSLFTGRLKAEQVADLLAKVEEASEAEAPIVFSLWVNDKKESRKDPEFSLQCFVGDSEDSPRSSRSSKKSSRRDEEEEGEDNEEEEEQGEEEEEEEERPRRGAKKASKTSKRTSKKSSSW